jgi:hypothetical protein
MLGVAGLVSQVTEASLRSMMEAKGMHIGKHTFWCAEVKGTLHSICKRKLNEFSRDTIRT